MKVSHDHLGKDSHAFQLAAQNDDLIGNIPNTRQPSKSSMVIDLENLWRSAAVPMQHVNTSRAQADLESS